MSKILGMCKRKKSLVKKIAKDVHNLEPNGEMILKQGVVRIFFVCPKSGDRFHYDVTVQEE